MDPKDETRIQGAVDLTASFLQWALCCGREIGRMDPRDAVRDTSGARAYSQFLVEMGERVPAVALPNVSVVLAHLDEEVSQEAFVF